MRLGNHLRVAFAEAFASNFQQKQAGEILNLLKEHPESWTRVDTILEFSQNQQTKYYALQILEKTIKTKWKALPRNQCEGKLCALKRCTDHSDFDRFSPLTYCSHQEVHCRTHHQELVGHGLARKRKSLREQIERYFDPGKSSGQLQVKVK